jgi:hypothetical protein
VAHFDSPEALHIQAWYTAKGLPYSREVTAAHRKCLQLFQQLQAAQQAAQHGSDVREWAATQPEVQAAAAAAAGHSQAEPLPVAQLGEGEALRTAAGVPDLAAAVAEDGQVVRAAAADTAAFEHPASHEAGVSNGAPMLAAAAVAPATSAAPAPAAVISGLPAAPAPDEAACLLLLGAKWKLLHLARKLKLSKGLIEDLKAAIIRLKGLEAGHVQLQQFETDFARIGNYVSVWQSTGTGTAAAAVGAAKTAQAIASLVQHARGAA